MREGKPTRWVSLISTHVSVRRRTWFGCCSNLAITHFNSRLRKETNLLPDPLQFWRNISTHVSVRRRTWMQMRHGKEQRNFNSRLRKETNSEYLFSYYLQLYFNSRLRKETNTNGLSLILQISIFQLTSP